MCYERKICTRNLPFGFTLYMFGYVHLMRYVRLISAEYANDRNTRCIFVHLVLILVLYIVELSDCHYIHVGARRRLAPITCTLRKIQNLQEH